MCIPDTDSIKTTLNIEELQQFCDIDDVKLGAWKNEGIADMGKFVRQKCYLEKFYNKQKFTGSISKNSKMTVKKIKGFNKFRKIEITCAGMPKSCYKFVTWDNFKTGFTCSGKLTFKHVKGGVKLIETDYTIKEEKLLPNIDKSKK